MAKKTEIMMDGYSEDALKDMNKPMGISGYKLSNKISYDLQENLSTIEDIESRINN